jgi:hypothetical protein
MEIYCQGCSGTRLRIDARDYSSASASDKRPPHLVLFHVDDDAAVCLQKELPKMMANPGAHVLCFKGTMLAGLTNPTDRCLIRAFRQEYPGRVHFLSFAVPVSGISAGLIDRFRNFGASIRESISAVDWSIIDPEWNEYLLAVYLATRALAAAGESSPLALALSDCPEFDEIVDKAEVEYKLLKGSDASLKPVEPAMAEYVASGIWQEFECRKA